MRDLAFYNHGTQAARTARKPLVFARRALRRVMRPMLFRLEQILESVCNRLDEDDRRILVLRDELGRMSDRQVEVADQVRMTMAFGWDYVAMVRRIAALEDRVEALTAAAESRDLGSIRFPDRDAIPRAEAG